MVNKQFLQITISKLYYQDNNKTILSTSSTYVGMGARSVLIGGTGTGGGGAMTADGKKINLTVREKLDTSFITS